MFLLKYTYLLYHLQYLRFVFKAAPISTFILTMEKMTTCTQCFGFMAPSFIVLVQSHSSYQTQQQQEVVFGSAPHQTAERQS